jgi:hypothetical protein
METTRNEKGCRPARIGAAYHAQGADSVLLQRAESDFWIVRDRKGPNVTYVTL